MPQLPVLHASGFSWDEALVLVAAIAVVPVLSWLIDRRNKRADRDASAPPADRADAPGDTP